MLRFPQVNEFRFLSQFICEVDVNLNSTRFPLAIVSTDTTALREISWTLSSFGFQAVVCSDWSGHAPWQRMDTPTLVLLDARDKEQTQAALAVSRSAPFTYRIALYDANLQANPDVLLDLGADDLICYPLNTGELLASIRRGIRRLEFEERFKQTTTFDLQSGVANRRGFTRQLERKLHHSDPDTNGSLIVMGIDYLENIRALHGSSAVERISSLMAETLFGELSGDDTRGMLAEGVFAALLPGQSLGEGVLFAEEVGNVVNDRSGANNVNSLRATLSGVVFEWPSGDTAENTIRRALAALQHVRDWGGNRVLAAVEIEREYAEWQQRFSAQQATDAQHVMEALPLILPISVANHGGGLGIYSFESGALPPCVPVVDDVGHLLGVVESETFEAFGKEVFGALDEHLEPVATTLRSDSRLSDIADSLKAAGKDYLLVVEDQKPIGYVTRATLSGLEVRADDGFDDSGVLHVDHGLSSLVVPLI